MDDNEGFGDLPERIQVEHKGRTFFLNFDFNEYSDILDIVLDLQDGIGNIEGSQVVTFDLEVKSDKWQ